MRLFKNLTARKDLPILWTVPREDGSPPWKMNAADLIVVGFGMLDRELIAADDAAFMAKLLEELLSLAKQIDEHATQELATALRIDPASLDALDKAKALMRQVPPEAQRAAMLRAATHSNTIN